MGAPCALRCHDWNDEWYGREGGRLEMRRPCTKMQLQGARCVNIEHACESDMESEWSREDWSDGE